MAHPTGLSVRSFDALLAQVRAIAPQLPVPVSTSVLQLLRFLLEERDFHLRGYAVLLQEWRSFRAQVRGNHPIPSEELQRRESGLVDFCRSLQASHERLSSLLIAFLSALPLPPSKLTARQQQCFDLLRGRVLTKRSLARKLHVEPSYLHRHVLKPLMGRKLIRNSREIGGYYRPDSPPTRNR